MINKVSNMPANVSFKGVYFLPNITYMSKDNKLKTEVAAKLINKYFPQTDVFLGANNENDLTVLVQKKNMLVDLLDPEIIQHMDLSPKELVDMINLTTALTASHNSIWGKKIPMIQDKIEGLDSMTVSNIFEKIQKLAVNFNEKYADPKN